MLVNSSYFEITFALLIIANTFVMVLECQYVGIGLGNELSYPGFVEHKDDLWPGAQSAFDILDYFFGAAFTMEILMKLIALKKGFCRDWWNIFDSVIVFIWLVDRVSRDLVNVPIDFLLLRLVRLA